MREAFERGFFRVHMCMNPYTCPRICLHLEYVQACFFDQEKTLSGRPRVFSISDETYTCFPLCSCFRALYLVCVMTTCVVAGSDQEEASQSTSSRFPWRRMRPIGGQGKDLDHQVIARRCTEQARLGEKNGPRRHDVVGWRAC